MLQQVTQSALLGCPPCIGIRRGLVDLQQRETKGGGTKVHSSSDMTEARNNTHDSKHKEPNAEKFVGFGAY